MKCLGSLHVTTNPQTTEIIASDDCSPDYNLLEQPLPTSIRPRRNPVNLGFAGNCNAAASEAKGEFVLLLNQDTRAIAMASDHEVVKALLKSNWLEPLLKVFRDFPDAGIVAPRLVFPSGQVQSVGGFFDGVRNPIHRFLGWANPTDWRINRTEAVSWATGAALMLRTADYLALGGLRGDLYPGGYFEDVHLCCEMRFRLGKRVYYCPDATLVHEAGSTGGNPKFMQNMTTWHKIWDKYIEPDSLFVHSF